MTAGLCDVKRNGHLEERARSAFGSQGQRFGKDRPLVERGGPFPAHVVAGSQGRVSVYRYSGVTDAGVQYTGQQGA